MEMKTPSKFHDDEEEMRVVHVDAEKIVCKNCLLGGGPRENYTKGVCPAYPVKKPDKVLFEAEECKYYVNENI